MTPQAKEGSLAYLKDPFLMLQTSKDIAKSGIVGEWHHLPVARRGEKCDDRLHHLPEARHFLSQADVLYVIKATTT